MIQTFRGECNLVITNKGATYRTIRTIIAVKAFQIDDYSTHLDRRHVAAQYYSHSPLAKKMENSERGTLLATGVESVVWSVAPGVCVNTPSTASTTLCLAAVKGDRQSFGEL